MRQRPFKQVDVFSAKPYFGNALAVVVDGSGLSDEDMQRFARWTNLAETTFVLPPTPEAAAAGADYQVRIFSTAYEMPFAGHPTLGSCHAWLAHGGVPKDPALIVQQCKVGLVNIRRDGTRLAFAAPPLKRVEPAPALVAALADALGLPTRAIVAAQHLNNGPSHFGLLVDSLEAVLALVPDFTALQTVLRENNMTGVGLARVEPAQIATNLIARSNREARAFGGNATSDLEPSVEVRFFADSLVVAEDPVTGSFNASLAQWLIADGHAPLRYVAAQGTCIGCEGRVHIERDAAGQVWVGGESVTCIDGTVIL